MRSDAHAPSPSLEVVEHLGFGRIRDLLVLCHDEHEPSDLDWSAWLARLAAFDYDYLLISTRGGGPCPKQRAKLALFWHEAGRPPPAIALLTDAEQPRSCMDSLAWFLRLDVTLHPASGLSAALAKLGSAAAQHGAAELLEKLHAELDQRCPLRRVEPSSSRPRRGRRGRST